MAEKLADLIAQLKLKSSQSSVPKPTPTPTPKVVEEEIGDEDDELDDDELKEVKPEKIEVKEEKHDDTISNEIALLHNEGIFRRELLANLNQINLSLQVIAGVVAELHGNK